MAAGKWEKCCVLTLDFYSPVKGLKMVRACQDRWVDPEYNKFKWIHIFIVEIHEESVSRPKMPQKWCVTQWHEKSPWPTFLQTAITSLQLSTCCDESASVIRTELIPNIACLVSPNNTDFHWIPFLSSQKSLSIGPSSLPKRTRKPLFACLSCRARQIACSFPLRGSTEKTCESVALFSLFYLTL